MECRPRLDLKVDWQNAGAWTASSSPCLQAACLQTGVQACNPGKCCAIQPCQAQSKSHRGKQNNLQALHCQTHEH